MDLFTSCEHNQHSLPRTVEEFNDLLVGYGNFLHQDDGEIQHCCRRRSSGASLLLPEVKRQSRNSTSETCHRTKEVFRTTRLLVEVALVIATAALLDGNLCFATSGLLGFLAVLRTGRDSSSQVGACPLYPAS